MACTSCACARWTSHGLSRGDNSERELSWCRKRPVLCSLQVQQCTEKPLLFCVSRQPQDAGFFFDLSIPQKTAVALGLDPKTATAIYPLSINTRCENRIFAAPRASSHGSGARGAAQLLPLSQPSPCGFMGQREKGTHGAITTPHQTPTGGLRRSRSALALVLHRLCAVPVCLLKGRERTGRVRGQT